MSSKGIAVSKGSFHQVASLLTDFSPVSLVDLNGRKLIDDWHSPEGLAKDCVELGGGDTRYALKNSIRRRELSCIPDLKTMVALLDANRDILPRNSVQDAIVDFAFQRTKPLKHQSLEELRGLLKVCEWFEDSELVKKQEVAIPQLAEVTEWFEWRKQLARLDRLTPKPFVGRSEELRQLRMYALSNTPTPFTIYGIGGIGKTSLLAAFLENHVTCRGEQERWPFVWIDFYDSNVQQSEDFLVLLYEAARQIGYQRLGDQCQDFIAFADELSEQLSLQEPVRDEEIETRIIEFTELLSDWSTVGVPVLWVIDSLEELQIRKGAYTSHLIDFCCRIASRSSNVRFYISGRERIRLPQIRGNVQNNLRISHLDHVSSFRMAKSLGIPEQHCIAISKASRGMPLRLRMLADHYHKASEGSQKGSTASMDNFWSALQGFKSDEFLLRFIDHVHDPGVAGFLRYGLQFRKISPEMLLDFARAFPSLLGGLVTELAEARSLVQKISDESWTTERFEDDVLIFRPELREELLSYLQSDKRRFTDINIFAVNYYLRRNSNLDKAEAVYHMLLQGGQHREFDKHWENSEEFEASILRSFYELPDRSKAYLASKTMVDAPSVPERIWRDVRLVTWENSAASRINSYLRKDQPEKAAHVLGEREERSPGSILYLLAGKVFSRLGELKRSEEELLSGVATLRGAVDSDSAEGTMIELLSLLFWVQYEQFSFERGEPRFLGTFHQLLSIARRSIGLSLGIAHMRLVCSKVPGSGFDIKEANALAVHLLSREIDRAGRSRTQAKTVRRLAAEVASDNIGMLVNVIKRFGLGYQTPVASQELGNAIASWSSTFRGLELELLAGLVSPANLNRRMLSTAWARWLMLDNPDNVGEKLSCILECHIHKVPKHVIEGICAILGFWDERPRTAEDKDRISFLAESRTRRSRVRAALKSLSITEIAELLKNRFDVDIENLCDLEESKPKIIQSIAMWAEIWDLSARMM